MLPLLKQHDHCEVLLLQKQDNQRLRIKMAVLSLSLLTLPLSILTTFQLKVLLLVSNILCL